MAKAYDNNLRGALFKNDDKRGDSDPDYKGQCEVDGVEYWIAGWKKMSKDKQPYLSIAFTQKEKRGGRSNDRGRDNGRGNDRGRQQGGDNFEDDIPFAPVFARKAWCAI